MSIASETPDGRARGHFPERSLHHIRLIALAAALLLFGSARATAAPITCDPDPVEGGSDTVFNIGFFCETQSAFYTPATDTDPGTTSNTFFFGFGSHTNTLRFLGTVDQEFELFMTAFYVDPGDVQFRMPDGRVCEQYALPFFGACVYYRVEDLQGPSDTGPPQQGTHYTGFWEQEILWFSVDPAPDADVFHAPRTNGSISETFFDPITVPGSYDPEPVPFFGEFLFKEGDPLIKGATDNFSDLIVSPAQVPEPATLLLLGVGLGGMAYRKKRRIQDNRA